MVKYFKGQVKVSDIQEAFDNILNTINNKITEYNNLVNSLDIDFNVGNEELGLLRHTLSVGGLKKVLDLYNGHILGCQIFKINPNTYIVSEGLYIKDRRVYRLPSTIVGGEGDTLYYDLSNNTYTFNPSEYTPGEWETILVPYESPAINGSDTSSLGVITSPNTSDTYDTFTDNPKLFAPYMAFRNNELKYPFGSTSSYTIIWQFTEPLTLSSINLTYGGVNTTSLTITDLNDNILLSDVYQANDSVKDYTGTFQTGNTQYSGIKIIVDCPVPAFASSYARQIGNIQLFGNKISTEFVPSPSEEPNIVEISKVNANRISKLCNTQLVFNEAIPDFDMKVESKALGSEVNETLNNSQKGQFIGGVAGRNGNMTLLGTQVSFHTWHGDSVDSYWEPFNYLFVPKGIANPYVWVSGEERFKSQKVWNYILNRPQR